MKNISYKGTERNFEELKSHLDRSRMAWEEVYKHENANPWHPTRESIIYLVDSVAMTVTIVDAPSAMAVNDDIYIRLIGKEQNLGKVEKIVKSHFTKC
jgi:hypothetical protein